MRPKLWGPDLLRGDETNNVEDGDLMVRENGQWLTDANGGIAGGGALVIEKV